MKRFGDLMPQIYDMQTIRKAHMYAKQDKSQYAEVQAVDADPETHFKKIHEMLKNGTYVPSEYRTKYINESGKERKLEILPYFPDRIIQWCIILVIEPILTRNLVYHTCASLSGRGQERVARLMETYLKDRENTQYCLKIDVHHFYPSIDRTVLKERIAKLIKDPGLLDLLGVIIDTAPGEVGIPIGSYLSQYLANIYLSPLDHKLKEIYRLYYIVRYMDDIIILHKSKSRLHFVLNDIRYLLQKYYHMELKDNYQIFPVDDRGIDFCGYRWFHDYILLRTRTKVNMIKAMESIQEKMETGIMIDIHDFGAFNAYSGMVNRCNGYHLYNKYMRPVEPAIIAYRAAHHMKADFNPTKKMDARYLEKLEKRKNPGLSV